jgi:hypothetical protein
MASVALSEMRWGIEDLGVWFVGEKRNGKFFWRSELVGDSVRR